MEQPTSRPGDGARQVTYGVFERISDRPGPTLMGATLMVGNDVYNKDDEQLGEIAEIVLDLRCGRIAYAVLSYGGFLGMGDKLFAVPWKALTFDAAEARFTLDATKDYLANAPGFDKDRWPNMADPHWAMGLHDFYGTIYDNDL